MTPFSIFSSLTINSAKKSKIRTENQKINYFCSVLLSLQCDTSCSLAYLTQLRGWQNPLSELGNFRSGQVQISYLLVCGQVENSILQENSFNTEQSIVLQLICFCLKYVQPNVYIHDLASVLINYKAFKYVLFQMCYYK